MEAAEDVETFFVNGDIERRDQERRGEGCFTAEEECILQEEILWVVWWRGEEERSLKKS
jgi:hypothetical protein